MASGSQDGSRLTFSLRRLRPPAGPPSVSVSRVHTVNCASADLISGLNLERTPDDLGFFVPNPGRLACSWRHTRAMCPPLSGSAPIRAEPLTVS
jgi:hypothetical protein